MRANTEGITTGECYGFQKGDSTYSMKVERKKDKSRDYEEILVKGLNLLRQLGSDFKESQVIKI